MSQHDEPTENTAAVAEVNLFGNYADWLLSDETSHGVEGYGMIGGQGAAILRTRQTRVDPDPPTPDLTIQLCTAGQYWLEGDAGFGVFRTPVVTGGMFGVGAPHATLDVCGEGRFEMLLLALPWDVFRPLAEETTGRDLPHLGLLHRGMHRDPTVEWLVRALWSEAHQGGPLGSLFADGLLTALLARLLALTAIPPTTAPAPLKPLSPADLRRALDFINDRLADDLSLSNIAAEVGYSPSHFATRFRQSLGVPPHQYVITQRVERACDLLRTRPDMTVAQAAAEVGFADQSHFARHHKRRFGVAPTLSRASFA